MPGYERLAAAVAEVRASLVVRETVRSPGCSGCRRRHRGPATPGRHLGARPWGSAAASCLTALCARLTRLTFDCWLMDGAAGRV